MQQASLDGVIAALYETAGIAATPATVNVLAGLLVAVRARGLGDDGALAGVASFFKEQHGAAPLWPGDASVGALVATNFAGEVVELSRNAAHDSSCTKVEPRALALAICGDEELCALVDWCCPPETPVVGLNARIALLTPGAAVTGEFETSTDPANKRVLSEAEREALTREMEHAESGRFIYVDGERSMCTFVTMETEYAFSDAWDRFEEYMGRWHLLHFLPRITTVSYGGVAKRISANSSGYGIGRPEPVAEGALMRMMQTSGVFAIPISFDGNSEAVFLDVTSFEEEDLRVFGVTATADAPIVQENLACNPEAMEQLRLLQPVTARLPSNASVQVVWLEHDFLARIGGPVALFNDFRLAAEGEGAPPPAVAFAVPLDPRTAIVIVGEPDVVRVHVVPRENVG
jgi:hypothetical protein